MREKYILVFMLITCGSFVSQSNDSLMKEVLKENKKAVVEIMKIKELRKTDSAEAKKLTLKIDGLKAILDAKEEKDILAKIRLRKTMVNIKGKDQEIKSVEVLIENGMMAKARVILTNDTVYETWNSDATHLFRLPVLMDKIGFYELNVTDPKAEFFLGDIIYYLKELDKSNYLPSDELVVLSSALREKPLKIGTDLNSFLDFRVYSDFLSLLNKEGNGLVQSEVSSKIVYNSFATGKHFFFVNYVEPYFKFSKFDDRFRNQVVNDTVLPYRIDHLKLNQYAYIELGCKLNIVRATVFQHAFDLLNVGMDFKYSDILINKSVRDEKTLNTFSYYAEIRGQFLKYKNFGLDFGFQGYFQKIQSSSIENYNYVDPYLITEVSIFYHPQGNPLNMIFIRFKNISSDVYQDFYSVLQFGVKSRLSFKNK